MAFYRGKRVSVYRKNEYSFADLSLGVSTPLFQIMEGTNGYIRAVKHIRGVVTVAPTDSSSQDTLSCGWAALLRWPRSENVSVTDLKLDASFMLHPVAYAMAGAPHSFLYEHNGITLGQEEVLYFIVKAQQSSDNVRVVGQLLYDVMVTPVAP